MRCCILMASPRNTGNTAALLAPFAEEAEGLGARCTTIRLYDRQIQPCTACRTCQRDWTGFGCRHRDDGQELFDAIAASDVVLLATPIYSWYCTPPLKALLDRMVYGMNKYYGQEKGPSLWAGKGLCALVTCGYPPEKGADLFLEGMRRYARHSRLVWLGSHCEQDLGYDVPFLDGGKETRTRAFARALCARAREKGCIAAGNTPQPNKG